LFNGNETSVARKLPVAGKSVCWTILPTAVATSSVLVRLLCLWSALHKPIPLAKRFKTWVYGRSLVGIAGSNPTGGMDVSVSLRVLCFQVEVFATD
jgi:hypothetical protein